MELVEFLLARVAEDEQGAREAGADAMVGWRWKLYPPAAYEELQASTLACSRRTLAECEAKRRIIKLHPLIPAADIWGNPTGGLACSECDEEADLTCGGYQYERTDGCGTLRLLALPYADHPDYDEAWRPTV